MSQTDLQQPVVPVSVDPRRPSPGAVSVPIASLLLALSALCWSGNHIIARSVRGHVPSWSISCGRWLVVAGVLGVVFHRNLGQDWPLIRRHWLVLAFLGIVGGGIFGALQFVGLKYTGALNMGVMNSVAPALIALASFVIFKDQIRALQIVGIGISLAGVLAIVSKLDWHVLATFAFNKGDLIIVLNMGLWAIYSACLRLRPPIAITSFLFVLAAWAAAVSVPAAALEYARGERLVFDGITLGTLAYSSFISSLLAYMCWARGVEVLGVARAGVFLHLVPVFGTLLATTLLGERLGPHHLVGLALILAGVTLAVRQPQRPSIQQR